MTPFVSPFLLTRHVGKFNSQVVGYLFELSRGERRLLVLRIDAQVLHRLPYVCDVLFADEHDLRRDSSRPWGLSIEYKGLAASSICKNWLIDGAAFI